MPRPYSILDVFTDTPFAGNPLAVVHEADDLDGDPDAGDRAGIQSLGNGVSAARRIAAPQGASAHLHAGSRTALRRPPDGGDRRAARVDG